MTSKLQKKLIARIERIKQFRDVGIAFIGDGVCMVIKKPQLPNGLRAWVVIEEIEQPAKESQKINPKLEVKKRANNNMGSELINMGLSCGSAVLAGAAATGSAAAIPVTGGASGIVTVLTYSAAIASAAQCGISIGRVFNEFADSSINETYLDSSEWYQTTSEVLDAVALAGAIVDIGSQAKLIIRMSKSSGKSIKVILKGLNRADRKRLAREIAAWRMRADTAAKFKNLVRAGKFPKLFKRHEVTAAMKNALVSAVGDVVTMAGSALGGNVNGVIVYIASD